MSEPEKSEPVHDETDEDASEAQAQVIASLRAQVTDLFSQVTQLNGKLVASYDRVSDLEDQFHDASSSLRNASVTISSLELERSHHLAALNTGLLVEKAHVTAELNRLMERATDEAAQRGQAESARLDIEKDLDDLSASLFDQANTMVAEARLNQARSEHKVQNAEQALKIAEDAVKDMQIQMQTLQAEKETAELEARDAKITMGKGKWVERDELRIGEAPRIRFMTTHAPYAEFIAFVGHLRGLRVSQPSPPAISTLLSQPFVARLINEDSEPTVRLDLAPSLNWLSRRSVLAAIHAGMLTVEPVPFSSLVQELHHHPQSTSTSSLSCSLCGTLIARIPSAPPMSRTNSANGNSWFKYPLALSSTQNLNAGTPSPTESAPPGQVYIFRLTAATTSSPPPFLTSSHSSSVSMSAVGTSSRPPLNIAPSRVIQSQTQNLPYPLCTSNYCLTRLRSTCSLWAFVRVGIMERIWEEEIVLPAKPHINGDTSRITSSSLASTTTKQPTNGTNLPLTSEKPPVPPRRRRLWEMASALSERAVSWGKENGENAKDKDKDTAKKIPPPPPSHPSAPHSHTEIHIPRVDASVRPPLPKRNIVRGAVTNDTVASSMQGDVVPAEPNALVPHTNGHVDPEKTDPDAPSTPAEDIIFATPPSEARSSPPPTTDPIIAAEPTTRSVSPVEDHDHHDHPPLPSPHAVPLPVTPTMSTAIARATSPVPRPRSRLSSPASPPPSSRPASPAMSRSRAGSPLPLPGHVPSVAASPMKGKGSVVVSSPLVSGLASRPASPAPASGSGAPPLPRRAPARRAVPLPPPTATSGGAKIAGEGAKEEAVTPTLALADAASGPEGEVVSSTTPVVAGDHVPEADAHKAGDVEMVAERKSGDPEPEGGVKEVSQVASMTAPMIEGVPESSKDVAARDIAVNGTFTTVVLDPPLRTAFGGDGGASVDTASTKHSSSTEGEGFASDATWEERMWKELARLKEEMFWARIGGVRAL